MNELIWDSERKQPVIVKGVTVPDRGDLVNACIEAEKAHDEAVERLGRFDALVEEHKPAVAAPQVQQPAPALPQAPVAPQAPAPQAQPVPAVSTQTVPAPQVAPVPVAPVQQPVAQPVVQPQPQPQNQSVMPPAAQPFN